MIELFAEKDGDGGGAEWSTVGLSSARNMAFMYTFFCGGEVTRCKVLFSSALLFNEEVTDSSSNLASKKGNGLSRVREMYSKVLLVVCVHAERESILRGEEFRDQWSSLSCNCAL